MYAEGLKILRKIAEDERNWRSGMAQIEALFKAAEQAEAELHARAGQKQALEERIARLTAEEAALRQSVESFTKKLGAVKSEYQAKEEPLLARLADLTAQIAAQEQKLAAAKAEFEASRSRLTG